MPLKYACIFVLKKSRLLKVKILRTDKTDKLDVDDLVRKWRPSGVMCNFSPSGSNPKNKNKSLMLIPILFHEVIINKCICHRFYFVQCIQFSQLNDLYIVRSCAQVRS